MWSLQEVDGTHSSYSTVLNLWMSFLLILVVSCVRPFYSAIRNSSWNEFIAPVGLILISLGLGLYRLTSVPYTVHGDEGMVGLYARRILEGDIPTFFSAAWYSLPQFFFWVPSVGMFLFGDSLFGLRMSSVLVGMLCVVPFYYLCQSYWGSAAAFCSGLLLITNHWFVHSTHSGVSYIQAVFFGIAVFALLHFMNQWRSLSCAALGGMMFGLSVMSYQANHLLPFLWIGSQLWLWMIREIDWKWLVVSIVLPLLTAFLVLAPLLAYEQDRFTGHEMFTKRAEGVSILSDTNWQHLDGSYKANGNHSVIIKEQLKRAFLSPLVYVDKSIQYSGRKPILDSVSAALWALSAALAVFVFWKKEFSLPLLWIFAILLAGGAMTVDPPFFPRLSGATALFFVMTAGLFGSLFRILEEKPHWQYLSYITVGIIVLSSAGLNLNHYFVTFANEISVYNIHARQTRLAYFMKDHCTDAAIMLVPGPHISTQSGTCRFLVKDCSAVDTTVLPNSLPKDVVVVIDPAQIRMREIVMELMPSAVEEKHLLPSGDVAFYSYQER